MKTSVIIPSGGKGSRIDSKIPKQYIKLSGKELIVNTLEVFQESQLVDEIVIAAQKEYFNLLNEIKAEYSLSKIKLIVEGGLYRQDSVYNAFSALKSKDEDLVVVHDAARPLLSKDLLEKAIKAAKQYDNVIVAIKAKDTLFKGVDYVDEHVDRNSFYYAQTPQIFRYGILKEAYLKAKRDDFYGTDESILVSRASYKVKIIEGNSLNFKITTDEDLKIFDALIKNT